MKRLLLIDDDQNFLYMLARVLTRRGFTVVTAATAEEAQRQLTVAVPDCAVVDMKLEQASGLELIAPLRAASERMRIVVLTGYASIATTVEAIKRGADNYLAKPLELEALLAALADGPATGAVEAAEPMSLRRLQWEHIQRVLDEHDGNISAAARTLGMHRRTLQRKLGKKPVPR
jgi:two-component system response regulator RegA